MPGDHLLDDLPADGPSHNTSTSRSPSRLTPIATYTGRLATCEARTLIRRRHAASKEREARICEPFVAAAPCQPHRRLLELAGMTSAQSATPACGPFEPTSDSWWKNLRVAPRRSDPAGRWPGVAEPRSSPLQVPQLQNAARAVGSKPLSGCIRSPGGVARGSAGSATSS